MSADNEKTVILLPVYNGERYLKDQLSSLFEGSDQDFIIHVSDDGSMDGTLDVIAGFQRKYPGRIIIHERPETSLRSAKANFLFLLEDTDADTYFFCDQDDFWFPDKIKKERAALDELAIKHGKDSPLLVFSDVTVTDEELNVKADSFLEMTGLSGEYIHPPEILIDNPAPGCTMCFNRALKERVMKGSVRSSDKGSLDMIEMHDSYVLMTAAVFGYVGFLNEPTLFYRQHSDNSVGAEHESSFSKIKRNLTGVFSGSFKKDKKEFIEKKKALARAMLLYEDLPDEAGSLFEKFINMDEMKKTDRMRFLKENNIRRNRHDLWFRLFA